jgi:broad specificity phosphatase PhoE
MEDVAITRRPRRPIMGRRPFLAPLWILAVLGLLAAGAVALALVLYLSAATTTIVVVRSGENGPANLADPPLTSAGEQRAQRLAQLFGVGAPPGRIAAIYVTAARRMQQMAAPLAARLGIRAVVISSDDANEAAGRALGEHGGSTVMVVTSGASVPKLVEALSGVKTAPLPKDDYGEIYIVSVPVLGSAGVVTLHY